MPAAGSDGPAPITCAEASSVTCGKVEVAGATAWAIVVGVMEIVGAVRLRKEIEGEWLLALGGILSIVFGLIIAFRPVVGAIGAVWGLGAVAIATGITLVALAFRLRKHKTPV